MSSGAGFEVLKSTQVSWELSQLQQQPHGPLTSLRHHTNPLEPKA